MVTENGIRNRLKIPKPELSDSDIGLRHNAQQWKGAIITIKSTNEQETVILVTILVGAQIWVQNKLFIDRG